MKYRVYQLRFQGAVHFGNRTLDHAEYTFGADTLYSALCHEALKMGPDVMQKLHHLLSGGQLLLSDAFPFVGGTCFLPKPMLRITPAAGKGDSQIKKAYKKLRFIPADAISDYLSGTFDVQEAPDLEQELGHFDMKVSASVRGEEETLPYRIETFSFMSGNGLYILVGYEEKEHLFLLEELLDNLSLSGIGGKRAAGLGRFTLYPGTIPEALEKRLNQESGRYMLLSAALPRREEMQEALNQAEYLLSRRSGFVSSADYAPEYMRKKDLYVLRSGSCVRHRFEGDIYDVSGGQGKHPVYRYAKPMFMGVDA